MKKTLLIGLLAMAMLTVGCGKDKPSGGSSDGGSLPEATTPMKAMENMRDVQIYSPSDGKQIPLTVEAGQEVYFGKYAGNEIKIDGEVIRKDGKFVHPAFEGLNPENQVKI